MKQLSLQGPQQHQQQPSLRPMQPMPLGGGLQPAGSGHWHLAAGTPHYAVPCGPAPGSPLAGGRLAQRRPVGGTGYEALSQDEVDAGLSRPWPR
eukprot:SRR837773.15088.p3 GENE.SRR837773.15088~~SRR837773.15088.p3  ORF type:complete len:105 (-),score=16.96 SRR837773.15088:104-385(-)